MKISEIISYLGTVAPASLQEHYDNVGLITGDADWECTGILCSLDATEEVIREAHSKSCNLVVAHHPIVFSGLKKISHHSYVGRTLIQAIKLDIAIYAIHTNLDNVIHGVNGKIASLVGLKNTRVLSPKTGSLKKLFTFVPTSHVETVRNAVFNAGAGQIGNYSECSFSSEGLGTYKAGPGSQPFAGSEGVRHQEPETKIEVVLPAWAEHAVVSALKKAHPYEEVAYDVIALSNPHPGTGSGLVGDLNEPVETGVFLERLKGIFNVPMIRHTALTGRPVNRVALCGGAGSFLISSALAAGADIFVSADFKYHEFFDAESRIVVADIGHYESEQFTINLLQEILAQKFPTFAVLKTGIRTNPVYYS